MFSFGLQVCVAINKHFAHYPSTFDWLGEPTENNQRRLSDKTMFTYVYLKGVYTRYNVYEFEAATRTLNYQEMSLLKKKTKF